MRGAINASAAHVSFQGCLRIPSINAKSEDVFRRKIVKPRALFPVGQERSQVDEEKVRFTEGLEEPVPYDQPVVWLMLEGTAEVRVDGLRDPVRFTRGEVVLLPAAMQNPRIKTVTDCVWLETTFPTRAEVG